MVNFGEDKNSVIRDKHCNSIRKIFVWGSVPISEITKYQNYNKN